MIQLVCCRGTDEWEGERGRKGEEGEKEGKREGGREGEREGERERGREEGGREGGREGKLRTSKNGDLFYFCV